jgi:hypothetical protein
MKSNNKQSVKKLLKCTFIFMLIIITAGLLLSSPSFSQLTHQGVSYDLGFSFYNPGLSNYSYNTNFFNSNLLGFSPSINTWQNSMGGYGSYFPSISYHNIFALSPSYGYGTYNNLFPNFSMNYGLPIYGDVQSIPIYHNQPISMVGYFDAPAGFGFLSPLLGPFSPYTYPLPKPTKPTPTSKPKPAPVPTIMSGDWESDNPANGTGIMEYTQETDKHLIMITPSFTLGKGTITEFSYIPTEGYAPISFTVAFPSGNTGTFEGVANNSLCSLDVVCVWAGSFIVTGDYSILDSYGLEVDSGTFTLESPMTRPQITTIPAPVPTIMSGDWESANPANGTGIMEYTQEADKYLIMITSSFALGKGTITEFSYISIEGDAPFSFTVVFPSGHTGTFEGVANNSLCSLDVVCVWAGSFIVKGDYSILDSYGLEVDSGTFTLGSQ